MIVGVMEYWSIGVLLIIEKYDLLNQLNEDQKYFDEILVKALNHLS